MFPRGYYPAGYWTPSYFPETGGEIPIVAGGGAVVAGLSRQHLLRQLSFAEYYRMEARAQRMRLIQEAQAKLSFQIALVRLRDLENEARRRMLLHHSIVATVLAEV